MRGVEIFVPLTKGYVATIDIGDWDKIRPYQWHAKSSKYGVYAARTEYEHQPYAGPVLKKKTIWMHGEILGIKDRGSEVDHKDGNGLDNRRHNLRPASRSQNCANRKIQSNNSSGFKGVNWDAILNRWKARVCVNNKRIHLGYFSTAEEAAHVYDAAAKKSYGEFARVNFPVKSETSECSGEVVPGPSADPDASS